MSGTKRVSHPSIPSDTETVIKSYVATFTAVHPCRQKSDPYGTYVFLRVNEDKLGYKITIREALIYSGLLDQAMYKLRGDTVMPPSEIELVDCTIILPRGLEEIPGKYMESVSIKGCVLVKHSGHFDRGWTESYCTMCKNRIYRTLSTKNPKVDVCMKNDLGWAPTPSVKRHDVAAGEIGGFTNDRIIIGKSR